MTPTSLSAHIEAAWLEQSECPRNHRYYLTDDGSLKRGMGEGWEVGWYSSAVTLADFRADVFHVFEEVRRRGHGR